MSLLCDCPRCGGDDKFAMCENGIDIALDRERRKYKRNLIILSVIFAPIIISFLSAHYG